MVTNCFSIETAHCMETTTPAWLFRKAKAYPTTALRHGCKHCVAVDAIVHVDELQPCVLCIVRLDSVREEQRVSLRLLGQQYR
jgi:hypothetical protein